MSLTLPPHVEDRIRHWIANGRYASVAEALEAAVHLLDAHDRRARLTAAIAVADAQIARGEGVELTPALWEEIGRAADAAEREGRPLNTDVCP